jgi:Spy/CpxP family protein refolding chaperone
MTKAKLAVAAVALSYILINSAARAAVDSTTTPLKDSGIQIEPRVNPDTQSNTPLANLAQEALGDVMELGGILTSDMPPPGRPMPPSTPQLSQRLEGKTALAVAPDAAPPLEGHKGMGLTGTDQGGPATSGLGIAMGGSLMRGHHRCPLAMLDGPNALSDDQYQKVYDIKGQFIANIVPKGLNMYMLTRKMKDLLTASDIDTKAVKDLERQISSACSDLSMTAMDSIVSVSQVLTPEQRKALHAKMIRSTLGGGEHHHHEEPHPEK